MENKVVAAAAHHCLQRKGLDQQKNKKKLTVFPVCQIEKVSILFPCMGDSTRFLRISAITGFINRVNKAGQDVSCPNHLLTNEQSGQDSNLHCHPFVYTASCVPIHHLTPMSFHQSRFSIDLPATCAGTCPKSRLGSQDRIRTCK